MAEKLVVSPPVLAELDRLVLVRPGEEARTAIMADLAETISMSTFTRAVRPILAGRGDSFRLLPFDR